MIRRFFHKTTRAAALGLIHIYRLAISPVLGPSCRFIPSCSSYTEQAIRVHGVWKGCRLGALRLLKCQPFGRFGHDPVPSREEQ